MTPITGHAPYRRAVLYMLVIYPAKWKEEDEL